MTTTAACDELLTLSGIWSSQNSIDPPAGMTEIYYIRSNEPGWDPHAEVGDLRARGRRARRARAPAR